MSPSKVSSLFLNNRLSLLRSPRKKATRAVPWLSVESSTVFCVRFRLAYRKGIDVSVVPFQEDVKILRVVGVKGVVTKVGVVVLNHFDDSHVGVESHCAAVCVGAHARTVPSQPLGL